jgi:hypothetical protein
VAQRETYNLHRRHGLLRDTPVARSGEVGALPAATPPPDSLPPGEIEELASACLTLREVHGQALEVTVAALSADASGTLSAADAMKVLARAHALIDEQATNGQRCGSDPMTRTAALASAQARSAEGST